MSHTFAASAGRGRHRLGRPGLVSVVTLVTVVRRGLFASWRHVGKHRPYLAPRRATGIVAPAPAI